MVVWIDGFGFVGRKEGGCMGLALDGCMDFGGWGAVFDGFGWMDFGE